MYEKLILDVGCGNNFKGNINIDLNIKETPHRFNHTILNTKEIPNFICADSTFLPFRDNTFDIIISSHCLEHTLNYKKMFEELLRVSNHKIKIIVPSRYSDSGIKRLREIKAGRYSHINFFTRQSLRDLCNIYKQNSINIYTNDYKKLQIRHYTILKLPISTELILEVYKTTKNI